MKFRHKNQSKQVAEADADGGKSGAGERGVAFADESFEVSTGFRTAVDFDPAFDREDDPVFLHAGLGVERGEGAVFRSAGDGDLDHEHGARWMSRGVIGALAPNE